MQNLDPLYVKKKLFSIKKLPSSPQIVQEVIKLRQSPNVSMTDYEKVISRDPSLAAEVLKIVNSPFYGLQSQVTSLKLALSMLGLTETYRVVATNGFNRVFRKMFNKISYNINLYWKHCQSTAQSSYQLACQYFPDLASEAYVAGLLHNVGKLVMEQFFSEQWQDIIKLIDQNPNDGLKLEKEVFGLTHCEIGAALLVRWNLPKEIVLCVRYHHDPLSAPSHHDLVNIAYFAEKTATYFLSPVDQKNIREFFFEDAYWHKMIDRYPELNVLENKDFVKEADALVF